MAEDVITVAEARSDDTAAAGISDRNDIGYVSIVENEFKPITARPLPSPPSFQPATKGSTTTTSTPSKVNFGTSSPGYIINLNKKMSLK